jgi:hypothetical protein
MSGNELDSFGYAGTELERDSVRSERSERKPDAAHERILEATALSDDRSGGHLGHHVPAPDGERAANAFIGRRRGAFDDAQVGGGPCVASHEFTTLLTRDRHMFE